MPMPKRIVRCQCNYPGCDKIVERRPYQLNRRPIVFCSRDHASAYSRSKIGTRSGRPRGILIERPCSCGCGRKISMRPGDWRKSDKQNGGPIAYYSIQCHNRLLNVPGRTFINKPGPEEKSETRSCNECGNPVTRRQSEFYDTGVFCGYTCSNTHTNRVQSKAAELHKICANPNCSLTDRKFTVMRCEDFRKYCSEACMGKDPSPEAVAARRASGVAAFMANLKTQNKQKNTPIEVALQDALTAAGVKFTPQVPLLGMTVVDIFIEPNICVFADGMMWHNLPEAKMRDSRNNAALAAAGYKVLRFSGKEIRNNIQSCTTSILSAIPPKVQ